MNQAEYCLLWINWWPLCMQKAEWAAWTQAVFSVVAIAAGMATVIFQMMVAKIRDRKQSLEQELRDVVGLRNALEIAFNRLIAAFEASESGRALSETEFDDTLFASVLVRDMPLPERLDATLRLAWLNGRHGANTAQSAVAQMQSGLRFGTLVYPAADAAQVRGGLETLGAAFHEFRERADVIAEMIEYR